MKIQAIIILAGLWSIPLMAADLREELPPQYGKLSVSTKKSMLWPVVVSSAPVATPLKDEALEDAYNNLRDHICWLKFKDSLSCLFCCCCPELMSNSVGEINKLESAARTIKRELDSKNPGWDLD